MTDYNAMIRALFTAPARGMTAQPPQANLGGGMIEKLHNALDPVQAMGGYGNLAAMALPPGAAKIPKTMPLAEFTEGRIRPSQTTVDWGGVKKYMKRIKGGERPEVEISPTVGTRFEGHGDYRIKDGHTRLRAYYELGIPDIPVKVRPKG
jgi:hypothetical protein